MKRTAYKIVRRDLSSLVIGGMATIKYVVGRKVFPIKGFGPLCVFDTKEDVISFMKEEGWAIEIHKVFDCEVTTSPRKSVWYSHTLSGYRDFTALNKLPIGTILCSSVTLTKEVNIGSI